MSRIRFDGMGWPHPDDAADLEWRLRYTTTASREDCLTAASVVAAYRQLIGDSLATSRSKLSRIRRALASERARKALEGRTT